MADFQWLVDLLMNETYPTYDEILSDALSRVPDSIDKRQGSLIFIALAPACYKLAEYYEALRDVKLNNNLLTAQAESLDLIGAGQGLSRFHATKARLLGSVTNHTGDPMQVAIGTRFSAKYSAEDISYVIVEDRGGGNYVFEAESVGTIGNTYLGELVPISFITNIGISNLTSVLVSGRDKESDDIFRDRIIESTLNQAFGGNIAQYREMFLSISGVGAAQIYPTGDGAGTVVVSVLDNTYKPVSASYLGTLKELIDPEDSEGEGVGLAPINHKVRITSGSEASIHVSVQVSMAGGYTLQQIESSITQAVNDYFDSIKKEWDTANSIGRYESKIYYSQLLSSISQVNGVVSVTDLRLGRTDNPTGQTDIVLEQSPAKQEVPVLGSINVTN